MSASAPPKLGRLSSEEQSSESAPARRKRINLKDQWEATLPRQFRYASWIAPNMCVAGIILQLLLFGFFGFLFWRTYSDSVSTKFISPLSDSGVCTASSKASQIIYLSKDGYWSNEAKFLYSNAILQFIFPQGYNLGAPGWRDAAPKFLSKLQEIELYAKDLTWAQSLIYMTMFQFEDPHSGIKMRYTAEANYVLHSSSSDTFRPYVFINTSDPNRTEVLCGAPVYSRSDSFLNLYWANGSDVDCDAFVGQPNDIFQISLDLRSAIVGTAINSKISNLSQLETITAQDATGFEYTVYWDNFIDGMTALNCWENTSTCFYQISDFSNITTWKNLAPSFKHFCEAYPSYCVSNCTCTAVDRSGSDCGLRFFVLDFKFRESPWLLRIFFSGDYKQPVNRFGLPQEYPNCTSSVLAPSPAMAALNQSFETPSSLVEIYYTCTKTVPQSVVYALSVSVSNVALAEAFLILAFVLLMRLFLKGWKGMNQVDKVLFHIAQEEFRKQRGEGQTQGQAPGRMEQDGIPELVPAYESFLSAISDEHLMILAEVERRRSRSNVMLEERHPANTDAIEPEVQLAPMGVRSQVPAVLLHGEYDKEA
eukprot:TRINITY_DN12101_c0_g1_i2.p1 TRINITY_DN12101_c0_g1~~TRINITY_DN12101_c0_g1_i2.p1  ORF type:complete len:593 (+),score=131.87 TRINITY_DN12101_c0_g1_i2:8-1786(+)